MGRVHLVERKWLEEPMRGECKRRTIWLLIVFVAAVPSFSSLRLAKPYLISPVGNRVYLANICGRCARSYFPCFFVFGLAHKTKPKCLYFSLALDPRCIGRKLISISYVIAVNVYICSCVIVVDVGSRRLWKTGTRLTCASYALCPPTARPRLRC